MDAIVQLWLPVLLAAVFVFVASSLVHMVFKWHNSDYRALANEDAVRAAIAAGTPPPGLYTLPHCGDMKAMQDPAMQAKYREGPVALLTVMANGMPNMGRILGCWFLLNLLVAAVAAVLALHAVHPADMSMACRAGCVGGAVTFMSYGIGSVRVPRLSGFLEVGVAQLDARANVPFMQEDETLMFFGIAGSFAIRRHWFLQLEYEYFAEDAQFLSLSIVKRFRTRTASDARTMPLPDD